MEIRRRHPHWSFLRKPESSVFFFLRRHSAKARHWIPAFAGMPESLGARFSAATALPPPVVAVSPRRQESSVFAKSPPRCVAAVSPPRSPSIPAKAGISTAAEIPAFAGMECGGDFPPLPPRRRPCRRVARRRCRPRHFAKSPPPCRPPLVIPAKAGIQRLFLSAAAVSPIKKDVSPPLSCRRRCRNRSPSIPAKAGISTAAEIPAFAGMECGGDFPPPPPRRLAPDICRGRKEFGGVYSAPRNPPTNAKNRRQMRKFCRSKLPHTCFAPDKCQGRGDIRRPRHFILSRFRGNIV